MYEITVIVHSEMEEGNNPDFYFEEKEKAYEFIEICLKNNFSVEVGRIEK
jgi:hypothetical protein